ncbi:hypothetical protein IQ260_21345 [Leptolyngbya cf. ectocarpi LEGE 11479]|uniref:Uncharacterized protein n=1 Tax=Leptolyngbya cf. ectocarpi LEGE 11479 TaxID=1828722 RepID=A0A928ZXG7_LEPEC|nr:hypothetical protein [Leptolyngbya ectocarpi]MBE9069195.1 hypothetical protein [Leptolyngbya cf. ectocarpi LEGE 11479]
MQPFREKSTQKAAHELPFMLVDNPQIWLAVATLPCLGILITGRTLTYWLTQFGLASEEIFRGIQLPVLDPDPKRPL